jgi:hypothetical protein
MIAWAWWSIGEKEDLKESQMQMNIQSIYETKIDHATDMNSLKDWTQKLQSGQTAINLSLQHLTDKLENETPPTPPYQK